MQRMSFQSSAHAAVKLRGLAGLAALQVSVVAVLAAAAVAAFSALRMRVPISWVNPSNQLHRNVTTSLGGAQP